MRSLLAAVEEASPIDAVDVVAAEMAAAVGARRVGLLIANLSGNAVVRMSHVSDGTQEDGHNERGQSLSLPGSVYERVLLSQIIDVAASDGAWSVLVPVTERGDTIGILELTLAKEPGPETLEYLVSAGHSLAYVLIASRRHTDLFEWAQRDIPFSVAAEIQRRLLPSAYTAEAGSFTLAGWLEPSYDAGGDSFDYSIDREYLYASLTDAMGHSTEAALLATLALGTLRNRRRALASPAEQADATNDSLRRWAKEDQFVTGLILRVRLADGDAEIVSAGHPPPYLIRAGRAVNLAVGSQPPLGVTDWRYRSDSFRLEPGDRLLLVSDGYLDRNAAQVDIEGILTRTLERHPRQIVQELARNVLDATGGKLPDDATTLCIDWFGPREWRGATGGASADRATAV